MDVKNEDDFIALVHYAAERKDDPLLLPMVTELLARATVAFAGKDFGITITRVEDKFLIQVPPCLVKDFVAEPDELLFLLLHEMVRRFSPDFPPGAWPPIEDPHTGRTIERSKDQGIAATFRSRADGAIAAVIEHIMINARLCALWFPQAAPLFLKLYDQANFPGTLFTPPPLLDLHRGRVIEHDPLYQCPLSHADFDFHAMPGPEFLNRIAPVFSRIEAIPWPAMDPAREKEFWGLEDEDNWVKGIVLWYWTAWSDPDRDTFDKLFRCIRDSYLKLIFQSLSPEF